jgi:hypothetical protein
MNNSLLDCFKEPSENLKNFIVKYDLWFYEAKFGSPDVWFYEAKFGLQDARSDKNTRLKNLLNKIMKEKKNSEYFFCSYSYSLNYTDAHPTDHVFFYGNKNEVKDKIASYLYLLHRNKYSRSFFCVYDFINDCEQRHDVV